jgi:hypothetical protein
VKIGPNPKAPFKIKTKGSFLKPTKTTFFKDQEQA